MGGDPDYDPAPAIEAANRSGFYLGHAHLIRVEGQPAVGAQQTYPKAKGQLFDVTVETEVKDGRLTLTNDPKASRVTLSAIEIEQLKRP